MLLDNNVRRAQLGVAACALGMALAGPQALGVASAETSPGDSAGPVSAAAERSSRSAAARPVRGTQPAAARTRAPGPAASRLAAPANTVDRVGNRLVATVRPTPTPVPTAPAGPTPLEALGAATRRDQATAGTGAAVAEVPKSVIVNPEDPAWRDPGKPLTIAKDLAWEQGVLMGTVGATCPGCGPLRYTVIGAPTQYGKVNVNIGPNASQIATGEFAYLPDAASLGDPGATETFTMLVNSTTPASAFLTGLPVVGPTLFTPLLNLAYQTPLIADLLAPLIGYAAVARFTATPNALAEGRPTAFTYRMPSYDGTLISVNYFPALNVANGDVGAAPTILNGAYLGNPGNTNPNSIYAEGGNLLGLSVPGVRLLRGDSAVPAGGSYSGGGGYNVVTWDPRGEFASSGVLNWDKPLIEGRDASAIISWLSSSANPARAQVATDGDAVVGMVGGSYGGAVQLNTAGSDPRVRAIVPGITFNSLLDSFYPSGSYLTSYGVGLLATLIAVGARLNPQIYTSTLSGTFLGYLTPSQQAFYASSGPTTLVDRITAPGLFIQGTVDALFPLQQAVTSAQTLAGNGVPAKMIWFCGGHGECLDPEDPDQGPNNMDDAMRWLDTYVARINGSAAEIPVFQWYDQGGRRYSSNLLPSDPGFNKGSVEAAGSGGVLAIVPLLGGSGPALELGLIAGAAIGTKAVNAVDLAVEVPQGSQIAGRPTVSFSYAGLGTARFLYAQVVDDATGRVLGNLTTPVPVNLDGARHTIAMPIGDIAYTAEGSGSALTLQLTTASTQYASLSSFGVVAVSDLSVVLPTVDPAAVTAATRRP